MAPTRSPWRTAAGATVLAMAASALAAAPTQAAGTAPTGPATTVVAADRAIDIPGFDVEAFAKPTGQKPAVLWFWNRVQSEAQVDRTLQDMHDAGFTETVIFRMDAEPFFSPAWFDRVEDVLEKSRELGMKVWLDNDSQFPSGAAGGLIVNGGTVGDKTYPPRPDLGVKTAVRTGDVVVRGGDRVNLAGLFGAGIRHQDGEIIADAAVFPGITLLREGTAWSDYTVAADFTIESGTAGFMVRSPDKRNGYLVDVRKTGIVDFWKQVDGSFSQLRLGSAAPAGWNPDGRHTISIRAAGDQISATLDGMEVAPVTDATFATGRVGMRVDGPQKWRLDTLEVTGGTSLYRNDFTDPASVNDFDVAVTPLKNVIAVTARPAAGAGATDLGQVVDLTSNATGDGTWDAPDGDWRVEAFTYRFRGDNYADTLDAEAMALYDQIIMGEYYDRFAWAFGTVLLGFADDEPSLSDRPNENAVPWTPTLAGRVKGGGTTVARAMVSVFNDMGRDGASAKGRFYRAASDQWVDTYWKPKYEWTQAHGVSIISNPLWDEHGPLEELRHSGNLLTAHQWSQIPGTDLIFNDVGNGAARFLPRTAASVAHQMGKPLVYDELMGATGWDKSLDDLREGTATSALRGINKALFHTTYDAIEGIPYPPVFMRENTWWPWMGEVNTWTGRLMEFGRHTTAAPTALLQTQRSNEAGQRSAAGFAADRDWIATMNSLEDSQVDFDLLDEGALTADPQVLTPATVTGGTLRVGKMTYTTVVVPKASYLSLEAARTLRDFVASGGEVVFAGPAPAMEVDGRDTQLRALTTQIRRLGGDRVVTAASPAQAGRPRPDSARRPSRCRRPTPVSARCGSPRRHRRLPAAQRGRRAGHRRRDVPLRRRAGRLGPRDRCRHRGHDVPPGDGTMVPMTLQPRGRSASPCRPPPPRPPTPPAWWARAVIRRPCGGVLTAQVRTDRRDRRVTATTAGRRRRRPTGRRSRRCPTARAQRPLDPSRSRTAPRRSPARWQLDRHRSAYSGSGTYTTQVTLTSRRPARRHRLDASTSARSRTSPSQLNGEAGAHWSRRPSRSTWATRCTSAPTRSRSGSPTPRATRRTSRPTPPGCSARSRWCSYAVASPAGDSAATIRTRARPWTPTARRGRSLTVHNSGAPR